MFFLSLQFSIANNWPQIFLQFPFLRSSEIQEFSNFHLNFNNFFPIQTNLPDHFPQLSPTFEYMSIKHQFFSLVFLSISFVLPLACHLLKVDKNLPHFFISDPPWILLEDAYTFYASFNGGYFLSPYFVIVYSKLKQTLNVGLNYLMVVISLSLISLIPRHIFPKESLDDISFLVL